MMDGNEYTHQSNTLPMYDFNIPDARNYEPLAMGYLDIDLMLLRSLFWRAESWHGILREIQPQDDVLGGR